MSMVEKYGFIWELDDDPKKGQLGLLGENHYRDLFLTPSSLQSTDVWLDIGANIGAFAIRAAGHVSRVVAMEPEPDCFAQLKENYKLNNITNIIPFRAAVVGDDSEFVNLAISNSFSSTHRVGHIRGRDDLSVPAVHINDVVQQWKINKIKCDCEGSEAEILEIIDLYPIEEIIFEYHFSYLRDTNWHRFYNIMALLNKAGLQTKKAPAQWSKTWHTIIWVKR